MKGIVFTEFLEMVEDEFGYETVDKIIIDSKAPSQGVYTAVGTYPFSEMLALVMSLSKATKVEIPILLKAFGKKLFSTFLKTYPAFFERCDDAFSFLESIDNYIHVEVKKLYADAELPSFKSNRVSETELELIYKSTRKLSSLAEGLIEETMNHYKQDYTLSTEVVSEDHTQVKFSINLI